MLLLEVPQNTNELRDHNVFIKAVQEFNKFQSNVTSYLEQIVKDEYLKKYYEWENIVNEKELKKLNKISTNTCFYCYKTNKFIENYYGHQSKQQQGWIMGAEGPNNVSYELSDDGVTFEVINTWRAQEVRFGHIPFHTYESIYEINLLEKSVKRTK